MAASCLAKLSLRTKSQRARRCEDASCVDAVVFPTNRDLGRFFRHGPIWTLSSGETALLGHKGPTLRRFLPQLKTR